MAFEVDKNGNIKMIQGDSGTIVVNGIKTDKNYTAYFAIRDKKRNTIGNELSVPCNKVSTVVFELTGDFTDLMTIPREQCYEVYYYGIKLCSEDGLEDTLQIGNNEIGYPNTITVFPKKVEGT